MAEKEKMTREEYEQAGYIYYGDFGGIDVSSAPPATDDDDQEEDQAPNILTPVSERPETNIFSAQPITGTGSYTSRYSTYKPEDFLKDFDSSAMTDKSKGGFEKFFDNQVGGALGAALTPAFGFPVLGLGHAFGQLAKKQHKKNADAIMSFGGNAGAMFKFNGQTVSRAPGSKAYTGNLGGMNAADMFRYEEISKNFIPGTMEERTESVQIGAGPQGMPGFSGLSGVAGVSVDGIIMDAFGTNHSAQRNESGVMMVSAGQAQRAREQEFRHMASQLGIDISGLQGRAFVDAAVDFKQFVDGKMKGQAYHGGFFHRTSNMNSETYAQALKDRAGFGKTAFENIADRYNLTIPGETIEKKPPPVTVQPPDPGDEGGGPGINTGSSSSDDNQLPPGTGRQDRDESDGGYSPGGSGRGGGRSGGRTDYQGAGGGRDSGSYSSQATGDRTSGRVGFSDGGVAAQPAGFVEGPPENFTEKQTVADDRPMSVPEGTFVINAAAVEFAGSDDIKQMLSKAYAKLQKKVDKSIRVAKIPTEDEIDVAVSRGEVIVPPEVAKIIGYDRLEKINNRGKKEVSRRQKKAGGGFLTGKKLAKGGEADLEYEDRIVTDEVRRKMKALVASLPDDVDVQSVYFQPGYPERQRLEDERARLNETLPTKGRFFSRGQVHSRAGTKRASEPMINVPMTPTLYNLAVLAEEVAHQDAYKYRQTYDPKKHKVDRETFFREQNYLEELRAKDFALSVVGGLFPKGDKTARGARASYERDFAKYLAFSDNPELVATYLKKYPELKRFIKEVSYPEAKMGSGTIPGGSFLTITDDNYYGPGQPRVRPDSSFSTAAMSEDVEAMNEYHASFGYMFDKFNYLVAQIFDPYVSEPRYVEGYTASLPD